MLERFALMFRVVSILRVDYQVQYMSVHLFVLYTSVPLLPYSL